MSSNPNIKYAYVLQCRNGIEWVNAGDVPGKPVIISMTQEQARWLNTAMTKGWRIVRIG